MKAQLAHHARNALLALVPAAALASGAAIEACSSSNPSNGSPGDDGGSSNKSGGNDSGTSTVNNEPGSCANPTLSIAFSPMYSAFIPGSTDHTFQIPAIVDGTESGITWSASDPSKVALAPSAGGGVMITVQDVGAVTVIATLADGTCGASALNITSALESDWQTGNARYNNGNSLHFGGGRPDGGFGRPEGGRPEGGGGIPIQDPDGGGPACTNCHGPTATTSIFKDVAHTPEQTAGFSDQELLEIVLHGNVPEGGYFDPNVIIPDASGDPTGAAAAHAYQLWHGFHHWEDITVDQPPGILVYLRSLAPAAQDGTSNFGGRGGFGDGGRRREGGGPGDGGGPG